MYAAYVTELRPAELIRYGQLPVPAPGPTDVCVRVEATTVNPVDTLIRAGHFHTPTPFPFVVGRDLVGTVTATDTAATGFTPGDRVWTASLGHGGRQGAAAEYAVVGADRLYRLPDGVAAAGAVTLLHSAMTAWLALHRHGRMVAGETVYVGGAAGGVGTALVTLAAAAGARVVASARPDDAAAVPLRRLYTKNVSIIGFVISLAAVTDLAAAATAVNAALAAGALPPRIAAELPLAETARAHRIVEGREPAPGRGKLVLLPP